MAGAVEVSSIQEWQSFYFQVQRALKDYNKAKKEQKEAEEDETKYFPDWFCAQTIIHIAQSLSRGMYKDVEPLLQAKFANYRTVPDTFEPGPAFPMFCAVANSIISDENVTDQKFKHAIKQYMELWEILIPIEAKHFDRVKLNAHRSRLEEAKERGTSVEEIEKEDRDDQERSKRQVKAYLQRPLVFRLYGAKLSEI